jgi:hypothetical protein
MALSRWIVVVMSCLLAGEPLRCGSFAKERDTPSSTRWPGAFPEGPPLGETGKAEAGHPARGPEVSRRDS